MTALIWVAFSTFIGLGAHIAWWRINPPKRSAPALLVTFNAALCVTLALLLLADTAVLGIPVPGTWAEFVYVIVLSESFTLAYIVSLPLLDADSPTFVILRAVSAAEPQGLDPRQIRRLITNERFFDNRLHELELAGWVSRDGDMLRLMPRGRRVLTFFLLPHRLVAGRIGSSDRTDWGG